jgi:hypothetical protein
MEDKLYDDYVFEKFIRLSDALALLPLDEKVGPKPSRLRKQLNELPNVDICMPIGWETRNFD